MNKVKQMIRDTRLWLIRYAYKERSGESSRIKTVPNSEAVDRVLIAAGLLPSEPHDDQQNNLQSEDDAEKASRPKDGDPQSAQIPRSQRRRDKIICCISSIIFFAVWAGVLAGLCCTCLVCRPGSFADLGYSLRSGEKEADHTVERSKLVR
jgi:hypothetical protein